MESPLAIGDTTTNSIQNRLTNTHLNTTWISNINSTVYSNEKFIQLIVKLSGNQEAVVLRRVQDSFINVNQLFSILVKLGKYSNDQINKYLNYEISQLKFSSPEGISLNYNDLLSHKNQNIRGYWISFDKAVSMAMKFDIYEFTKKLFLIDVHDFDELPKSDRIIKSETKLNDSDDDEEEDVVVDDDDDDHEGKLGQNDDHKLTGSPKRKFNHEGDLTSSSEPRLISKRLRLSNSNYPYTSSPINTKDMDMDLVNDIKQKYSELFKRNEGDNLSMKEVRSIFHHIIHNNSSKELLKLTDISLDSQGKTALHFASTLASVNLVKCLISLGLNSPVRGSKTGESPLISTIVVTNSMEKDNFYELLSNWLYPCIELIDNNKWSFLHYLMNQSNKKFESSKFYFIRIMKFVLSEGNEKIFYKLVKNIINLADEDNGNTSLHMAAENGNSWFIEMLIELGADLNAANKIGVKPIDYDIVKEITNSRKLGITNEDFDEEDAYLVELIKTSIEFLHKKLEVGKDVLEPEEVSKIQPFDTNNNDDLNPSKRLFSSINELLTNTNNEYDGIVNNKKNQINKLNEQLHNATLITTNNKFLHKQINDKLVYLDNLKLKMANITEKLEATKNEFPNNESNSSEYDADEPFRIDAIYNRLINNEPIDDLKNDDDLIKSLPDASILNARIQSYKQLNQSIENEIKNLNDYNQLTAKFKKVVSFCTGVDVNEVDELLDGLLDAVENNN